MSIKINQWFPAVRSVQSLAILFLSAFLLFSCKQKQQEKSDEEQEEQKESANPEDITTLSGFEVELIYSVPRSNQGSWVSLSVGPEGQLYASDQQGKGMYEVTVEDSSGTTNVKVEELTMPVSGAQGMVWALLLYEFKWERGFSIKGYSK